MNDFLKIVSAGCHWDQFVLTPAEQGLNTKTQSSYRSNFALKKIIIITKSLF